MKKRLLYIIFLLITELNCFSQSYKNIDSLRNEFGDSKLNDSLKLRNIRHICLYFFEISDIDSLINYSLKGYNYASKTKQRYWEINFLNFTGLGYWNKGDYDKAINYYEIGLKRINETGFKQQLANLYNNLGLAYWNKSDLPKALELYLKALDIDLKGNRKTGMSSAMLNIGLVYSDMGNYESALKYYFKSLKLCSEIDDINGVVNNYVNIGLVYEKLNNLDVALDYYMKALQYGQKIEDKKLLALVYNNLGAIHNLKLNRELALNYYELALHNYKVAGDFAGQSMVLNNVGDSYIFLKRYNDAIDVLNKALIIETELNLITEETKTRQILARAYANIKDYKNAFDNFVHYFNLTDTLIKRKNVGLINQMQKEIEMKNQEVELTIQKEKELAIKDAEKQKQFYLSVASIFVLVITIIFSFFLYKRFQLTNKQKEIIEKQKHLVDEKQKEILDSIHYAKRIQTTLLAHKEFIDANIANNFVLFKPKDIVSGDFYWATSVNTAAGKRFYLAVCDSTGHGVPGAFMSLLNINFLNEAINEKGIYPPNEVFDYVRKRLVESISKDGQRDGFDGILVCFNEFDKTISYAAANNAPVLIRDGSLLNLPYNKMPVGSGEKETSFELFILEHQKNDVAYFYTDGYADQFGGPKGKKFKYKQLNDLLINISGKSLNEQEAILNLSFEDWRGNLEQVDDVCIIGIRL